MDSIPGIIGASRLFGKGCELAILPLLETPRFGYHARRRAAKIARTRKFIDAKEGAMSQQSSAIVMFRALVMMVCLIAIPLAALFGTSLPDAFKAMKEGRLPAFIGVAHASTPAANPAEEPPKFEPTGPIVPTGAAAMLAPGGRVDDFGMSQPPKPAAFSSPQPPLAILAAPPVVQNSTPDLPRQGVSGVVPAGYVTPAAPDQPRHDRCGH